MKITTFNINDVNRRLPNLLTWLAATKSDVVCLQELKAQDGQFPETALLDVGYNLRVAAEIPILSAMYGVTAIAVEASGLEHMVVVALARADSPLQVHVDGGWDPAP